MVKIKQLDNENMQSKYVAIEQSKPPRICVRGIRIPLYQFGTQTPAAKNPFRGPSRVPEEEQTILESLLLAQWEDRLLKGLFRYDVTLSEIKVIDGRRKFLAQLNEGWPRGFLPNCEDKRMCHQENVFPISWHLEELLFCIASSEKTDDELLPSAFVPDYAILIIINETPVEYGHVFLVPQGVNDFLRVLDPRSLEMAVKFVVEINNCSFRLFYDSSMPKPSHLYFQAAYFPDLLPVELKVTDAFFVDDQRRINISTVRDYPVKTLLFECSDSLKKIVELLAKICYCLQDQFILYNLLISCCGKKFYLFLQQQREANSSILSAGECSGYFQFKSRSEYDQATEDSLYKLLSSVSIDDEGFQAVKQLCCSIASELAF